MIAELCLIGAVVAWVLFEMACGELQAIFFEITKENGAITSFDEACTPCIFWDSCPRWMHRAIIDSIFMMLWFEQQNYLARRNTR